PEKPKGETGFASRTRGGSRAEAPDTVAKWRSSHANGTTPLLSGPCVTGATSPPAPPTVAKLPISFREAKPEKPKRQSKALPHSTPKAGRPNRNQKPKRQNTPDMPERPHRRRLFRDERYRRVQ